MKTVSKLRPLAMSDGYGNRVELNRFGTEVIMEVAFKDEARTPFLFTDQAAEQFRDWLSEWLQSQEHAKE